MIPTKFQLLNLEHLHKVFHCIVRVVAFLHQDQSKVIIEFDLISIILITSLILTFRIALMTPDSFCEIIESFVVIIPFIVHYTNFGEQREKCWGGCQFQAS